MTTQAFVGDFTVGVATVDSPASYDTLPEVISISGLGATNELIDATHFGSGGSKEYISGLADGVEITVECNYIQNNTVQERVISDVSSKNTVNVQVTVTDSSPQSTFSFAAVALGWTMNPAVDDRNTISFVLKISGAITVA